METENDKGMSNHVFIKGVDFILMNESLRNSL